MAKKKKNTNLDWKKYLVGGGLFYFVTFIVTKVTIYCLELLAKNNNLFNVDVTTKKITAEAYYQAVSQAFLGGLGSGAVIAGAIVTIIVIYMLGEKYYVKQARNFKEAFSNILILAFSFIIFDYLWLKAFELVNWARGYTSADLLYPISGSVPIGAFAIAIILVGLIERLVYGRKK